jgi:hypothetical protein
MFADKQRVVAALFESTGKLRDIDAIVGWKVEDASEH